MFNKLQNRFISRLLTALLGSALLLSACAPGLSTTILRNPTATAAHTATAAPTATTAPVATVVPTSDGSLHFTMNAGSLATGNQTETIPAASTGDNGAYWEVLPENTRVTLQGYPINNDAMKPQIFIYPVKDLGKVNETAGKVITALQTLLQTPQEVQEMPFLPLFNAKQIMHPQVQYLDFKDGKGVRFLTQFSQGIVPINNDDLIYTYQGLTSDGKYFVAVVLPVNHPSLATDEKITGKEPPEFTNDYPTYLVNMAKTLNSQAASSFTPDLAQIDAMIKSLEIN